MAMGLLAIIKKRETNRMRGIKERVLKNKEAVIDVLGKNIKGARQCEGLMGGKCIGEFCEKFMEFKNIDKKTGKVTRYWRCAYVQTPLLLIETANEIRTTNSLLRELIQVINKKT